MTPVEFSFQLNQTFLIIIRFSSHAKIAIALVRLQIRRVRIVTIDLAACRQTLDDELTFRDERISDPHALSLLTEIDSVNIEIIVQFLRYSFAIHRQIPKANRLSSHAFLIVDDLGEDFRFFLENTRKRRLSGFSINQSFIVVN